MKRIEICFLTLFVMPVVLPTSVAHGHDHAPPKLAVVMDEPRQTALSSYCWLQEFVFQTAECADAVLRFEGNWKVAVDTTLRLRFFKADPPNALIVEWQNKYATEGVWQSSSYSLEPAIHAGGFAWDAVIAQPVRHGMRRFVVTGSWRDKEGCLQSCNQEATWTFQLKPVS